ncbi:hypothetical protein RSOL_321370 [Rhizoctonia solani AG-3 Rhs1AP]|uniref:DUF6532 domain-containing protein n=2 Tax=Rhizoctonia solani AG-3 TaxID=1086053 RepID=A0A074RJ17_9AGAM|nr:hypothetical protein RSOL_321370 [Rhizoctonia solani AG-3 Rhs1AP]KEP45370.1 hypothetical protein V565_281620 [Rhizoctonia solani 123E]
MPVDTSPKLSYPSSGSETPTSTPKAQDTPTKRVLPERERRIPQKAQTFMALLANSVKARANREAGQKRKVEAQARRNSKQPAPIDTPNKRRKAESSQEINESILSKSFNDLTTDSDRMKWYQAAIRRRDGRDVDIAGLELTELKEMFDDPEAAHEAIEEAKDSDDDMMSVEAVATTDEEVPPEPPITPRTSTIPRLTPLSRVDSSDHTTIMPGVQPNDKRGRDETGKRRPLSPSGEIMKPVDKGKHKAGNRSVSGAQHRPKDAALPTRFQGPSLVISHDPPEITTTSTNPEPHRSNAPPSAHASTTRPSLATLAKPPTATPANSSSATLSSSHTVASAKASVSTPANNALPTTPASNATGLSTRVSSVSNPRPKRQMQPASGSASKLLKIRKTRSAKHLKSRHKGRKRGIPSQDGATRVERTDDEEGVETQSQEVWDDDGISMRELAKLKRFGHLRWLVKAVSLRVKIRALKENPYADFTRRYSAPDENGHMHPDGYILDNWLAEEWRTAWRKVHPRDPVPRMEQKHVKWLYDRFSKLRNDAKAAVAPKIGETYGLDRNNTPEENKANLNRLGVDGFLSPTLTQNDPLAFRHPIFEKAILQAYFARVGLSFGYKHAKAFQPIPQPVYALLATMIHVLIHEFKTGDQVSSTLNAEDQLPWFNMFTEIIENIEENNYQSFENYRMRTFDRCYGISYKKPPHQIPVPPRDFGPDTQDVYVSQVHLPDTDSDNEMTIKPRHTTRLSRVPHSTGPSSRSSSPQHNMMSSRDASVAGDSGGSNHPVEETDSD